MGAVEERMNNLLFYCRPGFEKEIAAEIQDKAGTLECFGFSRVKDNSLVNS